MEPVTAQIPIGEGSDLPPALQHYMQTKGSILVHTKIAMHMNGQKYVRVQLRKDDMTFELLFDQNC